MADELLRTAGLNRFFGGLHAVRDVSFAVQRGQIKAIIGPNGAGKTTLFNLIAGTYRPSSGDVFWKARRITGARPHLVARMGIARTFQNTRLFPHMTVLENVMVGRHPQTRCGFAAAIFCLPHSWFEERRIRRAAQETLELLGVGQLAGELAANLAFGKQRIVEFARALATGPELLLLDEPAAGLNMRETDELAELILTIGRRGITCLVVEHDMSLVMRVSDEVLVLDQGRQIAEGPPRTIQKDPQVIRVYLGEEHTPVAEAREGQHA